MVTAQLESPLGVEKGLEESSPEVHVPEGYYIANILVRARVEVRINVVDAIRRGWNPSKGTLLALSDVE
jgi:hypothetical protein